MYDIDSPQVARTCILRAFGLQMSCRISLVLRLFCFVFVFILSLKPRPFVQSFFDNMQAPRQPHVFLFYFFPFVSLDLSLFPSIFCAIAVFSLCVDCAVRFFLPGGVFLPFTTGWIFLHQLMCACVLCFVPIYSGRQVRWMCQPGSHRIFHPPSFCGACLYFLARRIQPFLSLVDREVDFCVLTI